jgi:hypothetical protein
MRRPDGSIGMMSGIAQGAGVLSMQNDAGKEILFAGSADDRTGTLRLADAAGNECAALHSSGGGHLVIKDGAGALAASVSGSGAGQPGAVNVYARERRVAALGGGDGGGLLNLIDGDGQPIVVAGASQGADGGAVSVRNGRGVQVGRMGVDRAGGGEVAVYNATATAKKVVEAPATIQRP